MRLVPSIAFAFTILVAPTLAPAQDYAQPDVGAAAEPGVVNPEPNDPDLARLNKGECRKLAKKLVHYSTVAERANDRGDEMWEAATVAHMDRLEARWNNLCANEDDSFNRWFTAMLRTAGKLARRYFTMGWYP